MSLARDVERLIQEGQADVDHKGADGNSSLYVACQKGYVNIARLLWTEGEANVDLQDNDGDASLS